MKLQIERPYVESMVAVFPDLAPLKEQLRFGEKVEVPFHQLSNAELTFLLDLYRDAGPKMQASFAYISTLRRAFDDKGVTFAAEDLESVLPAIARYLVADAIRGWMFTANVATRPLPYAVTRLDYTPPSNDETGRVFIELKANAKGAIPSTTLRISAADIVGKTVGEIFAAKGFLKETPELIAAYDETEARYFVCRIPVHAYILMFHLELHHYVWVHVDDVTPYAYQPDLKQKLILPEEQTDLIDILTAEMDILMDDIIAGKSGGTTVLCAGPPGVGKTLTAEVYSEIIKRPLYRVHSGQLGLNVAAMEAILKDTLTRAQRWGAVMLIDEADVYIKRRDDDITMNAVVGVFLRVLEYFNGLLFLTTNRIDDIDEAIVSRCIALIKFYPPDATARRKIWTVMTEQFGLAVDRRLLEQLTETFPAASGRDIKGLAKLVAKYCHHKKVKPSLEAFKRCSIFRGMDLDEQTSP